MSKTIVITGANTGMGYATAKRLALDGNLVIALCRDNEANRRAINELNDLCKENHAGSVHFIALNLNNLHSVRQAAHHLINLYDTIDVLICNAGVFKPPYYLTQQKFEQQFQVNYLGQFLLTNLIMPSLNRSKAPIVINICSLSAAKGTIADIQHLMDIARVTESGYKPLQSYRESKLAQMVISNHMAQLHKNILFASVHPGLVNTSLLYRRYNLLTRILMTPVVGLGYVFGIFKTPAQGAQTALFLAEQKIFDSGKYWADKKIKTENPIVNNRDYADKLYEQSMVWVGLGAKEPA